MPAKPSDLDVASKLLRPKFRGVEFQCGPWEFGFDHAHAPHLYPDRDAGYIESTGRNPASYVFHAIFRLGIAGKSGDQDLYPTQWRLFVSACADRTTGPLVHPELGTVKAKCVRCRTTFDPQRRDGVDVDVEFVETSDKESELSDLLNGVSPMVLAQHAARNLDDAVGNADPAPEYPKDLSPDALESMKRLQGALAQFKMGIGNVASVIDNYAGALNSFRDTVSESIDPKSHAITDAIDRLYNALVALSVTATANARAITQAVVATTSTIDQVGAFFRMSLDEFVKLNPSVAERTTVAAGTSVFVYA